MGRSNVSGASTLTPPPAQVWAAAGEGKWPSLGTSSQAA